MMTAIILAIFALTLGLDYLPGRKSRTKRANLAYAVILAISFCVLVLYSMDVHIPGTTGAIQAAVKQISALLGGRNNGG